MCGFPRKVNRTKTSSSGKNINSKKEDNDNIKSDENTENSENALKRFFNEFKTIFLNPPFVCLALASAVEGILIQGFLSFISKFFEYQYRISATTSTIITSVIAVFSVIVGSISGAQIVEKFKFNSKKSSFLMSMVYLVTSFSFWMLLLSCKEDEFIDINKVSNNQVCQNCNCTNIYDPVCFKTATTIYLYQSACHVGCIKKEADKYSSCNCILNQTGFLLSHQTNDTVSFSYCDQQVKCLGTLIAGVFVAFFIVFLTALVLIPDLKAIMGTVDAKHQSFALGIRVAVLRVIGNFIGPIIFGYALDASCIYWKTNCYNQRVCKQYDNFKMSLYLAAIGFSCRFSSFLLTFTAWILLKIKDKRQGTMNTQPSQDNNENSVNLTSFNKSNDNLLKRELSDMTLDDITVSTNLSVT